jgi:hypothetical protein
LNNYQIDNDILIANLSSIVMLVFCLVFMMPLVILVCIQTKNMLNNETTSERFGKKKETTKDVIDRSALGDENSKNCIGG